MRLLEDGGGISFWFIFGGTDRAGVLVRECFHSVVGEEEGFHVRNRQDLPNSSAILIPAPRTTLRYCIG
jgi:hypothetical protein